MTRPRVVPVLFGLGAVALVVWVSRHTYWGEITVPMPLRGEALRNPSYAAQRLAESLGAHAERRTTLDAVGDDGVVVLSEFSWDVSAPRRKRFEEWVERGGRLVVDGTLIVGSDVFENWSGIARIEQRPDSVAAYDPDDLATSNGTVGCPDLIEEIGVGLDGQPPRYAVCSVSPWSWLEAKRHPTWQLADDIGAQVVRVNVGRGSVTMINGVPFNYRDILRADHGPLFVAATRLHENDQVVFMSEAERDSLLALTWRYGAPAVSLFLLFVALALWRSGQRFGPLVPPTDRARRSLAEQIRGTGRFALRWGAGTALHAAVLRALDEAAIQRVAAYESMDDKARVTALAKLVLADETALMRAFGRPAGRSFDVPGALALLESVRRQVLAGSRKQVYGQAN
jgi:hypothetical protein